MVPLGATFVGFGFGPIQAGLFLLEAQRSGAFGRLVAAEVVPEVVAAVRAAGGRYAVNVAHADGVETVIVGPVALENPAVDTDRERLIVAIAAAQEIASAAPSVKFYTSGGPTAIAHVLAAGLRRKIATGGPRAVVYAAENTTHAAALLRDAVMAVIPAEEQAAVQERVCFVDTVIAKMSGTGTPPKGFPPLGAEGLAPVTPGSDRAFLVEAFNHILITRPDFGPGAPRFTRGLAVFEEKTDLQPFEEAKLYGHNAVHALAAYLGLVCGAATLAELGQQPGMRTFLRDALVQESGGGLIYKYAGRDPLFMPEGFAAYADDLLARMVNPYLRDTTARVGRDPERKLGWDDRLIGALRLARAAGVLPGRYALGAAAALTALDPRADPAARLLLLWRAAGADSAEAAAVIELIQTGRAQLAAWRAAGCPDLAAWWAVQSHDQLEASR
jgi:mannitol-1-phosphate 5-dehydrogenase